MKKTQINILTQARQLFNEQGYANVTVRMIAQAMGISSGNLTYHFKKREEILEALYFDMVGVFDARLAALPKQDFTFTQIKHDIQSSMVVMEDYRFFWTDLYYLLKINDKIYQHFETAYQQRKAGYAFFFEALQNKKLLKAPAFATEYELLAEQMISHSNTWIYHSALYRNQPSKLLTVAYQSDMLLLRLYPYLSAKGKRELHKVLSYPVQEGKDINS